MAEVNDSIPGDIFFSYLPFYSYKVFWLKSRIFTELVVDRVYHRDNVKINATKSKSHYKK